METEELYSILGLETTLMLLMRRCEPFFVTEEMLLDDPTADTSRFGFTKMYSEDQWQQFSSDSDEKLLDIQVLSDLRAAPTAVLHALISHDQWTLDK